MFKWIFGSKEKPENQGEEQKIQKESSQNKDNLENDSEFDDETLQQKGIDPLNAIPDEPVKDECLIDFSQDYIGYLQLKKEEIIQISKNYQPSLNRDDVRHELGHKKGGRICDDKVIVSKLRSIGKEVIKQVGRKILTGSLSLTKISFPIKAMIPKSALETAVHATCLFPIMINRAAIDPSHLERFKYVITASISSFFFTNTFLKPLNPILGETLQASFPDGTQIYCEQISHHPPVSYFLVVGPEDSYRYWGYYNYDAKAGLNSITIINKGKRFMRFKDGQKIAFDFPNELYSGSLIGTLKQESYGKMTFTDQENGLYCEVILGKVKKRPSDYFTGKIYQNKKEIHNIQGTYLGYIDIDDKRYWDYRKVIPVKLNIEKDSLDSDLYRRKDLITLRNGDVKQAQIEKELLEELQRKDNKLRKDYQTMISKKK